MYKVPVNSIDETLANTAKYVTSAWTKTCVLMTICITSILLFQRQDGFGYNHDVTTKLYQWRHRQDGIQYVWDCDKTCRFCDIFHGLIKVIHIFLRIHFRYCVLMWSVFSQNLKSIIYLHLYSFLDIDMEPVDNSCLVDDKGTVIQHNQCV